jgi:hypothetical protein
MTQQFFSSKKSSWNIKQTQKFMLLPKFIDMSSKKVSKNIIGKKRWKNVPIFLAVHRLVFT